MAGVVAPSTEKCNAFLWDVPQNQGKQKPPMSRTKQEMEVSQVMGVPLNHHPFIDWDFP